MEDGDQRPVEITSTLDPSTEAWQIGAKGPPRVCLCCGLHFNDTDRALMGPYKDLPYRYVCSACWRKPFLFFPDKELADCGECWLPPDVEDHEHPTTGRKSTRRKRGKEKR